MSTISIAKSLIWEFRILLDIILLKKHHFSTNQQGKWSFILLMPCRYQIFQLNVVYFNNNNCIWHCAGIVLYQIFSFVINNTSEVSCRYLALYNSVLRLTLVKFCFVFTIKLHLAYRKLWNLRKHCLAEGFVEWVRCNCDTLPRSGVTGV